MHLIKVNATNSTNTMAKEMFRENPQIPATCIVAKQQLEGRGQRGTAWVSKVGQNLTFSIIFPKPNVSATQHFLLSAVVSTALVNTLKKHAVPKLKIKWPNDIMAANYKIGGVLIENIIQNERIAASVIGVGLNVNQVDFEGLPNASSLKLVSGKNFDLQELLEGILSEIEKGLMQMKGSSSEEIMKNYKKHLFRIHVPSTFQLPDKSFFIGIIEDISPGGKLIVRLEEEGVKEFDLKEIKLCW